MLRDLIPRRNGTARIAEPSGNGSVAHAAPAWALGYDPALPHTLARERRSARMAMVSLFENGPVPAP